MGKPRRVWGHIVPLLRTGGVGVVATAVDLLVLALLVELVRLPPAVANIPALATGAVAQFVGCRYFAFRAQRGSLKRQLAGFLATEIATLVLNAIAFHVLITATPISYVLARPLATFLVFIGFSYPLWRLVFGGEDLPASRT